MQMVETGAGRGAARVVSKAEFARHLGVSKARVSQYIGEGKLHGPALVPGGPRGDLVDVDEALRQLDMRLDPVQRSVQPTAAVASVGDDADLRRLNKARADAAETKAARDRAELLERNGSWVAATDVQRAWARGLGELLTLMEADCPTMAEALAQVPRGDVKAMTIALRQQLRGLRGRMSRRFADVRDAAPADAGDTAT